MISLNKISEYKSIKSNDIFIIKKDKLNDINNNLKNKLFINNKNDYITFNFYPNKTFITLETLENNKEFINSYKFFKEINNKELLFNDIYTFKTDNNANDINSINNSVKSNLLKFIHFTLEYDMFIYLLENIENEMLFKYDSYLNLTMYCDDIEIPGFYAYY